MFAKKLRVYLSVIRTVSRNIRKKKFEPEVAYLPYVLKHEDVCLHIGASDGRHSYMMSKLAPKGHIYAFEPSAYSYEILKKVTRVHRLKNVYSKHLAMSDRAGETELVVPIKTSGRMGNAFGFITQKTILSDRPRIEVESKGYEIQKVPTDTVDAFVSSGFLPKVDFIRCDVEGAEMQVLKGAVHTFDKFKPNVLIEIHPIALERQFDSSAKEVSDFFFSRGYNLFCLDKGRLMHVNQIKPEPWRDYFCIHPSRATDLPKGPFSIEKAA